MNEEDGIELLRREVAKAGSSAVAARARKQGSCRNQCVPARKCHKVYCPIATGPA